MTAFDPQTGRWLVEWPGRIARYNLVYQTPPDDPMQGLPLGNGRLGAIIWFEPQAIVWQMNRCDLIDEMPCEELRNWDYGQEERVSTLRHAGQVRVEFALPVFDRFYMEDCHGEVDLSMGAASMVVDGRFGKVRFEALVDYDADVVHFGVEAELAEEDRPQVVLERYGSRTFSHWYSLVRRDAGAGLAPTRPVVEGGAAGLVVEMSGREFAFGGRVDGGAPWEMVSPNAVRAGLPPGRRQVFRGAIGCTPLVEGAAWARLGAKLEGSEWEVARGRTAEGWRGFWERSHVDYGDDYVSNLYHLALYYLNASQRGSRPGRFINGLWGWNRDVQPWNFVFHWNQQQLYWSVAAAGHPELCEGYLAMRLEALPRAMEDAWRHFGVEGGAWVSDVADWEGRNSVAELGNHTPVAQIALDLYRHYQYTEDRTFLREKAYPYLRAAARFLRSRFAEGADGLYHAAPGTGYEGWTELVDCISEISCLQALLRAVTEAAAALGEELPEAADYLEVLNRLAPYPQTEVAPFADEAGRLQAGCFAGAEVVSPQMLAAGRLVGANEVVASVRPGDEWYGTAINEGIFPWIELCPVFPAGVVGLSQAGSETFRAAVNTARVMSPDGMGWSVLPVVLARLGLAEETEEVLGGFAGRWQWFANGFGHYGPTESMLPECRERFLVREVIDAERPQERLALEMWPFRHMGLEPLGVLSAAVTESLLQSHDGVIRVFPARRGEAAFTLHAVGGTLVSAEMREGRPTFVALQNPRGATVRVANPWESAAVYAADGRLLLAASEARVLEFRLGEAGLVVLSPGYSGWPEFAKAMVSPERNREPKEARGGQARLGLPRLY